MNRNVICRYYQKGETLDFQGVENEWPIFFIFMIIDGIFKSLPDQVEKYQGLLEGVITVDPDTGDQLVPRLDLPLIEKRMVIRKLIH